jgi:hypothetical protein
MMANPMPPTSWVMLRQSKIMNGDSETFTTESPVVVHPLTDSNIA